MVTAEQRQQVLYQPLGSAGAVQGLKPDQDVDAFKADGGNIQRTCGMTEVSVFDPWVDGIPAATVRHSSKGLATQRGTVPPSRASLPSPRAGAWPAGTAPAPAGAHSSQEAAEAVQRLHFNQAAGYDAHVKAAKAAH